MWCFGDDMMFGACHVVLHASLKSQISASRARLARQFHCLCAASVVMLLAGCLSNGRHITGRHDTADISTNIKAADIFGMAWYDGNVPISLP